MIHEPSQPDPNYFDYFLGREATLELIRKNSFFDLVIVGGGIHGAALARAAAFNGLKVLLVEARDYASATSGRSSKMLHGGLRYLEMGDFRQVFEGLKARRELFKMAPHLCRPHRFKLPIFKDEPLFKLKVKIGLTLYDLLARDSSTRHRYVPINSPSALQSHVTPSFSQTETDAESSPRAGDLNLRRPLAGYFEFSDGLMDDARLVFETIASARREGALALNHARFDSFSQLKDGVVEFSCTDLIFDKKFSGVAGIIVNCAGPWVPLVGRLPGKPAFPVKYSRGVHLYFDVPWSGSALLLRGEKRTNYYFIWPFKQGTLVGTTDRATLQLSDDPRPTQAEVDELLQRIQRDLGDGVLPQDKLRYAFAGIRTLPVRPQPLWRRLLKSSHDTLRLSRRHLWILSSGMLSLVGGKYTTAFIVAEEGLRKIFRLAGRAEKVVSIRDKPLSGSYLSDELVANFTNLAQSKGASPSLISAAILRWGARIQLFVDDPNLCSPVEDLFLLGELLIAVKVEQATTLEGALRWRLGLEHKLASWSPDWQKLRASLEFVGLSEITVDSLSELKTRMSNFIET